MFKKTVIAFACFFVLSISAQGIMTFRDGKQYQATNAWSFICENYALGGILNVQIAKTDKGGLLQLSIPVSENLFYIGGTVYLFLEDNSVITCTDKGFRQNQLGVATSWYVFSVTEMSRLKNIAILNVRFAIKGKEDRFTSQTGHFFTLNRKSYYEFREQPEPNKFPTAAEVNALYQTQ